MKKNVFVIVCIGLLSLIIGFIFSFSFIREGLSLKLFAEEQYLKLSINKYLGNEINSRPVRKKHSEYSLENIITLPVEGEIDLDQHSNTMIRWWDSVELIYPNFRALKLWAGFTITLLSWKTISAPFAFEYGNDLIEMHPTNRTQEEFFFIQTEQSLQTKPIPNGYPCVSYIKGSSINRKADEKCMQIFVGAREKHFAVQLLVQKGSKIQVTHIPWYYE